MLAASLLPPRFQAACLLREPSLCRLPSRKVTLTPGCLFGGCSVQVPRLGAALADSGLLAARRPGCWNRFEVVALWLAAVCAVCVGR